jgi:bifunctional UDP-N-acetylglucosamine pyrophosphorylase/glucosamine-1-phosphate N-acetyltransferase
MARLRQGADIGPESKIGNFVEVKKARLERGVKVSHLSYIGDAEIGENSNIGCGFITCNYDGANKHQTKIGRNSFIGSDCQAIAPIEIGNDAFVAAGTTLTKSVPDGAFAIARAQLTVKEGAAKRFLKSKKP